MQGTRYGSAKLRDPEVIEALAQLRESDDTELPLEGFDALSARLANLEDRITQLIYVTAHNDSSVAPKAARPQMPHERRRRELHRERARNFELQLIPGGD